jgi:hypothetical protein
MAKSAHWFIAASFIAFVFPAGSAAAITKDACETMGGWVEGGFIWTCCIPHDNDSVPSQCFRCAGTVCIDAS